MGEQGGGAIRVGKHDEGPRTPGKRYLTPFFPDTVFPPAAYAPPGGLASLVNGHVSGGFAGITTGNSYNSRLFPTLLSASSSNGTALSLSYTYFANGNVNVETNGRDNGRSVTYAYDALSRVSTATSQATSGSDCWGQSFGYDRYANLTTVNVTQCTAPMLSLNVNTNNQISNSGFSYDSAGDLTADGVNTYSWNAEQHLNSAASVTYTYDGDLRRVKKSSGTLYWYCAICGQVLAESDLSGNLTSEYALFNKQRIARRDVASGNVYYLFHDRLGSYRTLTDSTGHVQGESDYYPFGAERVMSGTVTDNFRFAGMEWDSEDGLNHTLYRQYTSAQGRWETPDPKRGGASNPQSLDLYAYVRDNPTNAVDPRGDQCFGAGLVPGPYFDICECCADDLTYRTENAGSCCIECDICNPSTPTRGGKGGGSGFTSVCDCYLDCPNLRVNGCNYECYCTPGGYPWTARESCSILQSKAFKPCPNYIYYVEGNLVVPGETDFCGSYPQPPKNPPRPRPRPPSPPPPPPGPIPEPVPVP
jgi:RHS repeat-associated protein